MYLPPVGGGLAAPIDAYNAEYGETKLRTLAVSSFVKYAHVTTWSFDEFWTSHFDQCQHATAHSFTVVYQAKTIQEWSQHVPTGGEIGL